MKAIIYAGIGLFSVATVYGVADYYSSKKNGDLDKLYTEEEATVAAPKTEEKTTTVIPVAVAKEVVAEAKKEVAKEKTDKKLKKSIKAIRMENFSRARIPEEPVVEEIKEEPVKKPEEKVVEKTDEKEITVEAEKPVVEKKITLDMFSRAPLKKMKRSAKKVTLKN